MINIIRLSDIKEDQFISADLDGILTDFNRINIFVGENNSGKSRFLRSIKAKLGYILTFNNDKIENYKDNFENIKDNLLELVDLTKDPFFSYELNENIIPYCFLKWFNDDNIEKYIEKYKVNLSESYFNFDLLKSSFNNIKNYYKSLIETNINFGSATSKESSFYFPTLRGIKPLFHVMDDVTKKGSFNYTDLYEKRIKHDYPKIGNVSSGLSIYEDLKKMLLGDEHERELIKDFENYLSEKVFSAKITLIPKYGQEILYIKIGDDPQRNIIDLGDGLQTIICLLFPIYIKKLDQSYFFIEEPESHLHPVLQKKLVNLLSDDIFFKHQYFITTHSAHFINQKNSSVFNLYREGDKTLVGYLDNNQKIISALNNLGYKPSDLLQTNYIVWVEGIVDKIYLNYLIFKYNPELIENIHYSIMFFGGSGDKYLLEEKNNYEFIFALNRNCAIIKDSDKTHKDFDITKKKEAFEKLEKHGVLCWITTKRELENHINPNDFLNAVKKFLNKEEIVILDSSEFGDYFKINEVTKSNNPYSPNRNLYLTQELFDEIGRKKGEISKSDKNFIITELERSIKSSDSIIKITDKAAIASILVMSEFEIDDDLQNFLTLLCSKIKKVNNLE